MARLALANATDHGRGSRRCSVGPCISDDRSARAKLKDALSRRFTVAFPGTGRVWAIVMQKRQRVSQLPERQRLAATNRVAAPVSSQSWLSLNGLREADAAVGATRRPRFIWAAKLGSERVSPHRGAEAQRRLRRDGVGYASTRKPYGWPMPMAGGRQRRGGLCRGWPA